MALTKVLEGGIADDAVGNTKLDLSENYAFTGNITGSGKIIQALSTVESTQVLITSTSYVTTGIAQAITPKLSSSKILIIANMNTYKGSTNFAKFAVYRDSTQLGVSDHGMGEFSDLAAGGVFTTVSCFDSPSSTSAITYTIYGKVNSSDLYVQPNNVEGAITVMEIGA